jgi:hypothetical protein
MLSVSYLFVLTKNLLAKKGLTCWQVGTIPANKVDMKNLKYELNQRTRRRLGTVVIFQVGG